MRRKGAQLGPRDRAVQPGDQSLTSSVSAGGVLPPLASDVVGMFRGEDDGFHVFGRLSGLVGYRVQWEAVVVELSEHRILTC